MEGEAADQEKKKHPPTLNTFMKRSKEHASVGKTCSKIDISDQMNVTILISYQFAHYDGFYGTF